MGELDRLQRGGRVFAESPEALLGVVTIYEKLGEAWRDQSAYDKRPIYERDPWEVL